MVDARNDALTQFDSLGVTFSRMSDVLGWNKYPITLRVRDFRTTLRVPALWEYGPEPEDPW